MNGNPVRPRIHQVKFGISDLSPDREWVQVGPAHAVSSLGDVASLYTGRTLRAGTGSNGRLHVGIKVHGDDVTKTHYVHVLVCAAFHGPRVGSLTASHIDGNVLRNHSDNLIWETQKENQHRRIEHGTTDKGHANRRAVMTPESVTAARSLASEGWSKAEIARHLGVSRPTISRIVNGQRYAA